MNIRKITAILFLAAVVGAAAFAAINSSKTATPTNTLSVSASFYPLYDFAKAVGGKHVSVTNITPAGAEPHSYEPSPKALVQAQKADVFLYNGSDFEPWTDKFAQDYRHTAVKMSDAVSLLDTEEHHDEAADEHEHHGHDPHYWLDPVIAQTMVGAIRDSFIKADPGNRTEYQSNAGRYIDELKQLDTDYRHQLSQCSLDTIVTSHNAFAYLSERYGFSVESIAGLSPEQEPSAAKMADITKLVQDKGIGYILFETLVSPRLADTIAQETGAKTAVFDPLEGLTNEDQQQGKNYLSVQRENLATLRSALACKQ